MKILDAGHVYELSSLDGGEPQVLRFVKREGDNFPFNKGAHPGTNIQEVVRAIHDRLHYLYKQKPCWQTLACIWCCEMLQYFMENRAAERHDRLLVIPDLIKLMNGVPCPKCQHIGCEGKCH